MILINASQLPALHMGNVIHSVTKIRHQPPEGSPIYVGWGNPRIVDEQGTLQPGPNTFGAWDYDGEWGCPCKFKPLDVILVKVRGTGERLEVRVMSVRVYQTEDRVWKWDLSLRLVEVDE